MKTLFYIEKDGQVFLVRKGGELKLPEKKEIPFEFKAIRKMPIQGARVFYCTPKIQGHPKWLHKDKIPGIGNVDSLARLAVNRSLVRHVSEAIIPRQGKVLMVKAKRGFTKGIWDLPGGFINFGETPEESLEREVKEETGLEVKAKSLFHIHTNISLKGEHYFISFIYLCDIAGGKLNPDTSEIEEVKWLPIEDAIKHSEKKHFVSEALKLYKKTL